MMKDPVCGMEVDPKSAVGHVQYLGKDYYFCSDACQRKFEASPQDYVETAQVSSPPQTRTGSDTLYTCPNHPEVLAPRAGICPKCGATLEPLVPKQNPG